jgi:ribosomal protein L34E
MNKNEQAADTPERTYLYYVCKGTYEDDGGGGRRRICSGHIFTIATNMNRCPACGKPLEMIKSGRERPEAITCALEKCIGCEKREQSAAVNDAHCLGGSSDKNGRIQKTLGSRLCGGCVCAACCKEVIEDANTMKEHGLGAVMNAKSRLRETARQALRAGSAGEKMLKLFAEIRTQDAVLHDIRHETYERWAVNALNAVEKELAHEAKARRIQCAQSKNQEHKGE